MYVVFFFVISLNYQDVISNCAIWTQWTKRDFFSIPATIFSPFILYMYSILFTVMYCLCTKAHIYIESFYYSLTEKSVLTIHDASWTFPSLGRTKGVVCLQRNIWTGIGITSSLLESSSNNSFILMQICFNRDFFSIFAYS